MHFAVEWQTVDMSVVRLDERIMSVQCAIYFS